jgi:uncharacterized protein DUF4352
MGTVRQAQRPRWRIALAIGVASLAAVVVIACGGGASANSGSTTSGSSSTTSASTQHFKVGQQVKVGSTWVITVNSVKTSQGDDVFQPKSGNTFLIVDLTAKNVSSTEQTLSSILSFTLKDSTGQKYDETIVTGATAPDGKVAAGDQVRGQLAYEVPASMKAFTFAFEADILSSGQTIWDLAV